MREEILRKKKKVDKNLFKKIGHRSIGLTGYSFVNYINKNELKETNNLLNNKLKRYLQSNFSNYDYYFHNDIGINLYTSWHKDRLNNNWHGFYRNYEKYSPWSDNNYNIYKCLIYLQDHSNSSSLNVIPFSHKDKNINTSNQEVLYTNIGDIIIFDQRLKHKGNNKDKFIKRIIKSFIEDKNIILITVGFGNKYSKHLEEFKKGTLIRQNRVDFIN